MRLFSLIAAVFLTAISATAQGTISPQNPVVNPGATQQFACTANCGTGGVFTCANTSNGGSCLGSITNGGLYTAPATLAANQSIAGYQLLPNDHIFNTRVDSLPVKSGGGTFTIAAAPTGAVRSANVATVTFGPSTQLAVGTLVTVAGVTDATFNGTVTVLSWGCGNTCFTYSNPGTDTTSGGGTLSVPYASGMGTTTANYLASFPINYTNGSTPTDTLSFFYTPANNGTYQSPQWPSAGIEGGWFGALASEGGVDHHMITVDTTNGNLSERYQYYAQAPVTTCTVNGANSATCTITPTNTSPGFARAAAVGSSVQLGTFSGGDTYLNAAFTLTAATTSSVTFNITHGPAVTSTTGQATMNTAGSGCSTTGLCNSQEGVKYTYKDYPLPANGAADAAGMFLEPLTLHSQEVVNACVNGTAIKHALRATVANAYLNNSFLWPATTNSTAGLGINPYGQRFRLKAAFAIGSFSACAQILLTQMKTYGLIFADGGTGWQIQTDFDNLPAAEVAILSEINAAAIPVTNWEPVDESGLMESAGSGASNNGEIVTYTSSTGTPTTHVDLQGTAVNVNTNQYYIMAGTPAQQLIVYSNGGYTCSMSPTVGTLTSGCLYTPPATRTSTTSTTVTVTSSANAAAKAVMIVYVTPSTARFIQGTADFVDSHGQTWYSGNAYGIGMSNVPSWQGCCQNDGSFTNITDKQLWWNHLSSSSTIGDYKIDFHVPAGKYLVTFNNGSIWAVGAGVRNFYAQGVLLGTIDTTVAAGGQHLPYTLNASVTVGADNTLSFYNAGIGSQANNGGDISSISIMPAGTTLTPGMKVTSGVTIK